MDPHEFERLKGLLEAYFRKAGVGEHNAQDLAAETLEAGHAQMTQWRGESSFQAYLFGIAYNKLCGWIARKEREHEIPLETGNEDDEQHLRWEPEAPPSAYMDRHVWDTFRESWHQLLKDAGGLCRSAAENCRLASLRKLLSVENLLSVLEEAEQAKQPPHLLLTQDKAFFMRLLSRKPFEATDRKGKTEVVEPEVMAASTVQVRAALWKFWAVRPRLEEPVSPSV